MNSCPKVHQGFRQLTDTLTDIPAGMTPPENLTSSSIGTASSPLLINSRLYDLMLSPPVP